MIASFADPGQRTTSAPFGHALNRLAEERPEDVAEAIVFLASDGARWITGTTLPIERFTGIDVQVDAAQRRGVAEALGGIRDGGEHRRRT